MAEFAVMMLVFPIPLLFLMAAALSAGKSITLESGPLLLSGAMSVGLSLLLHIKGII